MKVLRYNVPPEPVSRARLGVLLDGNLVGDLRAGYARYLVEERKDPQGEAIAALRIPPLLLPLMTVGQHAWDAVRATADYLSGLAKADRGAAGLQGEPLFAPLDKCRLHAPIRPTKMIAVGRNYSEHLKEFGIKLPHAVPSAWDKAVSTIIGPTRDIVKPAATKELDYETELAIVVGRKCKNVKEENAYDVIAGYMVVNDISARDVVKIERKEGNQLLGKMFDTFAPMGPWLVTKDEIPDPMNLRILTRVNGEARQDGSTRNMIWNIPQLIAWLSQMTLEAGDVILTGTPDGVAATRKPDQPSWFLKNGDVLESEVEKVGVLRNRIVDANEEVSWKW